VDDVVHRPGIVNGSYRQRIVAVGVGKNDDFHRLRIGKGEFSVKVFHRFPETAECTAILAQGGWDRCRKVEKT
jgi:hypothetical protein